ncbi:restriction endonuclease subunit S [Streptomyces pseudovenezuelae]|uniref:restriction endonuclease subunit S n=1 Tax=Streptomyces pseudovenezuelae TaxID=67350 RepID=UPI0036E4B29D
MAAHRPWRASGIARLPLGDYCRVTAGPSGSLLDSLHDGSSGVPVIAPPDLTEYSTVDTRRIRRVPESQSARLARFALQAGDVLLVRQGTLGRLALIDAEQTGWFYSSSCLRIRPDRTQVLPEYLAAYLTHPPVQHELVAQAQSGTVPSLNSAMLNEFPVEVPPLARQRDVVDALADIDEQIAIQRMMLNRLVALRPSVFDQLTRGE